jgi:hypothetical protein
MLPQKFSRVIINPAMQGPFAWPFKVLRDLFINPPFVADPEFTPLDFDALRRNEARKASNSSPPSKSTFLNIDESHLIYLVLSIELILAPLLGLIILSRL